MPPKRSRQNKAKVIITPPPIVEEDDDIEITKVIPAIPDPFVTITQEEKTAINKQIRKMNDIDYPRVGSINSFIFNKFLGPKAQLNDEIINIFAHLLQKKHTNYYYANTLFITINPVTDKLEYRLNYLPKNNLLFNSNYEKLFFPILDFKHAHWVLVVVDMKTKAIWYYDSLFNERLFSRYSKLIQKALKEYNPEIEFSINHFDPATPQQPNGYDCGVYVCAFMHYISNNKPLNFIPDQVINMRYRIKEALLKGSI